MLSVGSAPETAGTFSLTSDLMNVGRTNKGRIKIKQPEYSPDDAARK